MLTKFDRTVGLRETKASAALGLLSPTQGSSRYDGGPVHVPQLDIILLAH